ncbi:leucyl aminopeptidase, partial [Escherichia coli]|nr:leucyl aminopeptidase [Escherichia coli]
GLWVQRNTAGKGPPLGVGGEKLHLVCGGLLRKSYKSMNWMQSGMGRAATVYGVVRLVAALQLPINVIGVLAGCENMPGGRAYRPGDALTTMSGQTVEVLNTYAEGRLELCGVLTYVARFEPESVIVGATLTLSCLSARGHHLSCRWSNPTRLPHQSPSPLAKS